MGGSNVARVYRGWGTRLKDRPFRLLGYMALVSMDNDKEPWFGLGHDSLAEFALGLHLPIDDDPVGRDRVLRIVRRHVTVLHAAGAIETTRRARTGTLGTKHVVYRLYLDGPWLSSPFADLGDVAGAWTVAPELADRR